MKDSWDWDETDLGQLIASGVSESLTSDYKDSRALDRGNEVEISKHISAFANSDGGVLVYGMSEQRDSVGNSTGMPNQIDGGVDPSRISVEWIGQVIDSRVRPRLLPRINQVQLAGTSNVVYIVYVPRGNTGHMAGDNKYYKRFERRSVPMEDYEVRDVMGRAERPDLRALLQIQTTADVGALQPIPADLVCQVANAGAPASYFVCGVYVMTGINVTNAGAFSTKGVRGAVFNGRQERAFQEYRLDWKSPERIPVFDGPPELVGRLSIEVPQIRPTEVLFLWECRVPGVSKRGAYFLAPDGCLRELTLPWDFIGPAV